MKPDNKRAQMFYLFAGLMFIVYALLSRNFAFILLGIGLIIVGSTVGR